MLLNQISFSFAFDYENLFCLRTLVFIASLSLSNKSFYTFAMQLLIFLVFVCNKAFRLASAIRFPLTTVLGLGINGLFAIWLLSQPSGARPFFAHSSLRTLVGSNGLFAIWLLSQPSGARHFRQVLSNFGGLKWTRTIDLTLIRRVL